MHTVNRGGVEMTIPLNITHHIPPRLIGHLDDEGILICDKMLKDGYTVQEVLEFFKTYVPVKFVGVPSLVDGKVCAILSDLVKFVGR